MPFVKPQVLQNPHYNLQSSHAKYLEEALQQGAYLHNPDADFDALLMAEAPQCLAKRKAPLSGFDWSGGEQQAGFSRSWW